MHHQAVQLNFRDDLSRSSVLHEDAALSSTAFGWGALYFEHRREQTLETIEHVMQEHYLMVKLNPASKARRTLDGVARREAQQRGSTAYVPCGCSHRVQYDGQLGSLHLMTLQPALVESVAQELNIPHISIPPHYANGKNDFILSAAELIHAELRQGNPHGPIFAETFSRTLAAHLLTGFSRPTTAGKEKLTISQSKIKNINEYIHSNLGNPITLTDLAAQANLSEYHFCRVFKKATQLSPYQYLLRQRIQHACAHLERDRLSVQEIAFTCGFSDSTLFARHFRKVMGMTPTAYRVASEKPELLS
jgi:AraC family transcriptional regulator